MATCYINTDPTYRPQRMFISSVTRGEITTITTSEDHNYITGLIVRLFFPRLTNIQQLNGTIHEITVTGDTTFTIPVDSNNYDAFNDPDDPNICAQVVPIGERNDMFSEAVRNVRTR